MKNILVPTDFSDVSKNALKFAIKIAHALRGKIVLFHAEQPILLASDMGGFVYPDVDIEGETHKLIDEQMDEWIRYSMHQNVPAEKILRRGILKDSVGALIEEEQISLVVTGTQGAKGIDSFFFGTNSVDIFNNVTCPVLIIPANARYHGIKTIMYATDLQYGDIHELEKVSKLAKAFNAEVIVSHVNNDPAKISEEKETMDWFEEIAGSNIAYSNISYRFIHHTDVMEALENSVKTLKVDILCMSATEKSFFKKLVSKSNTREMAFHTTIPLMALHLEKENRLL